MNMDGDFVPGWFKFVVLYGMFVDRNNGPFSCAAAAVGSPGCAVWSAQFGMRSLGCAVWSAQFGVRSFGCAVWGAQFGMRSFGCAQYSDSFPRRRKHKTLLSLEERSTAALGH